MTIALRDFLNWFEGFAENIEAAPTEKQWGKIKERIGELKKASDGPPSLVHSNLGPPSPTDQPVRVNGDATKILAQVEELKKRGAAGQTFSGTAADAGPPPAARKR